MLDESSCPDMLKWQQTLERCTCEGTLGLSETSCMLSWLANGVLSGWAGFPGARTATSSLPITGVSRPELQALSDERSRSLHRLAAAALLMVGVPCLSFARPSQHPMRRTV